MKKALLLKIWTVMVVLFKTSVELEIFQNRFLFSDIFFPKLGLRALIFFSHIANDSIFDCPYEYVFVLWSYFSNITCSYTHTHSRYLCLDNVLCT